MLDDGRQHFGFRDGLSQPVIRELNPQAAKKDAIAAGELVLGYSDETGEEPLSPKDGDVDIGRDGTFVVLRQLEQDVPGFWKALRERAEDDAGAVWLAAKMVGRWPDGAPVGTEGPNNPPSAPYAPPSYANDPYGLACPRGAHIRRANPRDGFDADPEISLKKVRRHRLLRRGRPYGAPAPPETYPQGVTVTARDVPPDTPNDKRGIYFVCLCADLARQFELVQQSWLNNAKHDGMYDEVCPIAAGRGLHADARRFTLPQHPIRRRLHELPQFVTVRGSAYLFLPGRSTLLHLAGRPVT